MGVALYFHCLCKGSWFVDWLIVHPLFPIIWKSNVMIHWTMVIFFPICRWYHLINKLVWGYILTKKCPDHRKRYLALYTKRMIRTLVHLNLYLSSTRFDCTKKYHFDLGSKNRRTQDSMDSKIMEQNSELHLRQFGFIQTTPRMTLLTH